MKEMMKRNRRYFRMVGVGLLLAVSVGIAHAEVPSATQGNSSAANSLPKGVFAVTNRRAPALVLDDIDGNRFDLAKLLADGRVNQKGRWIFVHFWASWCGPCRREIPAVQRMVEKLPEDRWALAIINTAEDEDTVFTFLGVLAPDLVPLMDSDGTVTEVWQPRGLPSTYLVDPSGVIRYQVLGGQAWDEEPHMKFLLAISAAH